MFVLNSVDLTKLGFPSYINSYLSTPVNYLPTVAWAGAAWLGGMSYDDSRGELFLWINYDYNANSAGTNIESVIPFPGLVELINGGFQDVEGNPLSNGYLILELMTDEQVIANMGTVSSGTKIKVLLDVSGNVLGNLAFIWPNDALLPLGSVYTINAYAEDGQFSWGPFYGQIISPSPVDLNKLLPADLSGFDLN